MFMYSFATNWNIGDESMNKINVKDLINIGVFTALYETDWYAKG